MIPMVSNWVSIQPICYSAGTAWEWRVLMGPNEGRRGVVRGTYNDALDAAADAF